MELVKSESLPFILCNTIPVDLKELETNHIIPVNKTDNILISQAQFVRSTIDTIRARKDYQLDGPFIRVSHPNLGRVPSALHKAEVDENEKTIHYERMMFYFRLPEIRKDINGQYLSLFVGGVMNYSPNKAIQSFQFFMGWQVKVCSNLCIWMDDTRRLLSATSLRELNDGIRRVLLRNSPFEQLG